MAIAFDETYSWAGYPIYWLIGIAYGIPTPLKRPWMLVKLPLGCVLTDSVEGRPSQGYVENTICALPKPIADTIILSIFFPYSFPMNCNCSRCSILNLFNKVSESVKLQEKLDSDNVFFTDRLKIKERLRQLKIEIEAINVPMPQMWANKIRPIFN